MHFSQYTTLQLNTFIVQHMCKSMLVGVRLRRGQRWSHHLQASGNLRKCWAFVGQRLPAVTNEALDWQGRTARNVRAPPLL